MTTDTLEKDTVTTKLSKSDRCDASCPAQAFVLVRGVSGELMFCSHHYNKIMTDPKSKSAMEAFAFETVDEREGLVENRLVD